MSHGAWSGKAENQDRYQEHEGNHSNVPAADGVGVAIKRQKHQAHAIKQITNSVRRKPRTENFSCFAIVLASDVTSSVNRPHSCGVIILSELQHSFVAFGE